MGSDYFTNPFVFLIQVVFQFYLLAIMLRFLLQWLRADFYNPISQFIVKITNPPLLPLRKIIPSYGGIDLAALILMLIVAIVQWLLIVLLRGYVPTITFLLARSLAELVELFLNIYLFSILIQVVLSWIAPYQYNPVTILIHQLNEPLLQPIRRLLPSMGGFDFSPLIAVVLIQISKMFLLPPLMRIY
ncbi:MAG: YggT family protein [Gammaproteobacteria bacterium]|nr:YggT family protein [Gammaproteobacteria bacterium]